jgi:hypothetical protein
MIITETRDKRERSKIIPLSVWDLLILKRILQVFFFFVVLVLTGTSPASAVKETVLIYGETFTESVALKKALCEQQLQPKVLSEKEIGFLSPEQGRLLILAGDKTFPPEVRKAVDNYLSRGGNLILAGIEGFNYSPKSTRPVTLIDFKQRDSYQLIRQKRIRRFGSLEQEKTKVSYADGTRSTLEIWTEKRAMHDVMLKIPLGNKPSPRRSVICFRAKGNAYMDLMALEITDRQGKRWYHFTPISGDWNEYEVSMADFIPEGWTDESRSYPLLRPEDAETLFVGVNLLTVWREQAMYFGISDIALAENEREWYCPSSSLKSLRLPYLENNMKIPEWLFDPMYKSQTAEGEIRVTGILNRLSDKVEPFLMDSFHCLSPYLISYPGSKMGTDNSKNYDLRITREKRVIPLMRVEHQASALPRDVARVEVYAGGRYKGAGVGLFGIHPQRILADPFLLTSLVSTADYLLRNPVIMAVQINTSSQTDFDSEVSPLLSITLKNPIPKALEGNLYIWVAGKLMQKPINVSLPPNCQVTKEIILQTLPESFPFHKFNWEVSFASDEGEDLLQDSVDVERSLLLAFRHMISAQNHYPDGRISHHYFGDAYGIRAMFAYLDLLRQQPERLKQNPDIWQTISPEEIADAAYQFCDMLVARQTHEGAFPMGYAEHSGGFNVADGGQIALSLAQISAFIHDQNRKKAYLEAAYRFADWAESFYIDSIHSAELAVSEPEEFEKGHAFKGMYGLGKYGSSRKLTGPSWVGADILAMQICLGKFKDKPAAPLMDKIADRNIRFYVPKMYPATGYYQAEALFWSLLSTKEKSLQDSIVKNLNETFIAGLKRGIPNDMFELGSRKTLNALPLLYYQRFVENNASVRAILLKYVWTFGSNSSCNGMANLMQIFSKPVHGESLSSVKYAALSSLWAVEILQPGSTLIRQLINRED